MQNVAPPKVRRIIDANFNRAKEGLRVCEDICRFVYDDPRGARQYKILRHRLTTAMETLRILDIITARDVGGDVGRSSISREFKRRRVADIFYANSQRVKESIRVLEEFTKLLNASLAERLKTMRYKIYALEKNIIAKG